MGLFNLLETSVTVFGQTYDVYLNWIGKIIRWLCDGIGVVGVGIILFSLILKLITLPFDIYQRISMRKQNIQMKANQEQMEKLQKQYANDKATYNQKVMEMYKANGISVFSSCLPMILSLVIFIVAINAFNAYAQYSNVENYNTLVDAYNAEMTRYCPDLTEENYTSIVLETEPNAEGNMFCVVKDDTAGKFLYYKVRVNASEFTSLTTAQKVDYIHTVDKEGYYVDVDRAVAEDSAIAAYVATQTDIARETAVSNYLADKAQDAVVIAYDEKVAPHTNFGWIKNIWVVDAAYKHPVLSASEFLQEAQREKFEVNGEKVKYGEISGYTKVYSEVAYDEVTRKLDTPKDAANGYFILIALSIGTILLQQFVMQRSQKEQQKYSSVDGQSGSQQKMMMVIMTGMFAIFSFMYSSAFSIYLITSNLFSMGSTLIINKFVDRSADKKEAAASVKKFKNHAADRIEKAKNAGRASAEESKKKNNNERK